MKLFYRNIWFLLILSGMLIFLIIPLPRFDDPTATVVFSSENDLLGARIADDGQWRFPKTDSVPEKYEKALLAFEDRWFYYHPGVNPVSLLRAVRLNLKHQKVVSGGSTLSMQVARLSRKNPPRNFLGKILEMGMALKLEILKSKKEILRLYASAAPFGGNVVGIDAASWRYFGHPAHDLSWAEATTLAVLPNAPSLIFPGKNQPLLQQKRDRLLNKLLETTQLDSLSFLLAVSEPLPVKPNSLPAMANHAVEQMAIRFKGEKVVTTIQKGFQDHLNRIVARHNDLLKQNHINNLAALVVEVETGNIVAYVGNAPGNNDKHGLQVDIITSARSTGSILKPFLYAAMLQNGEILPQTLVKDIPVNFSGYSPKNFDYTYSGAIPADKALSRSLNVPAVEMLHKFGEARFLDYLRGLGFTTFNKPAEHYGLSLILGGGEATLLELAGAYAAMARILYHYQMHEGYHHSDIRLPSLIPPKIEQVKWDLEPVITASSVWFTFEALREVNRPEERAGWWNFSSSGNVAWKTGTSFGFRDAWAIAITPQHVVAVWAGNASGEGRAGLIGSKTAGPVLFDILDLIPKNRWFEKPVGELTTVEICNESGYKISPDCPNHITTDIPLAGLKTGACLYHHIVHLTADKLWQANASCYPAGMMVHQPYFVLPPAMEWYYRKLNPDYSVLPPLLAGCQTSGNLPVIELIYPRNLSKLFVPLEMDGTRGKIIFEAAHRGMNTRLFWHLNDQFVGETDQFHQMALSPSPGMHTLTIIDTEGNRLEKRLEIVEKRD